MQNIMDSSNMFVKNTFYHINLTHDSSSRRSRSLPPAFSPKAVQEDKPFASLELHGSWADNSTDASEEEFTPSTDSTFGLDTDTECEVCLPSDESPVTPAALPKTPLSSKAAVWQPRMIVQDPLPYTFGQEAAQCVTFMKKAVEDSEVAEKVDVESLENGWLITVWVTDKENSMEAVLNAAKAALLGTAAASSCTYVLGYAKKPFYYTDDGFEAVLGAMRDESRACWKIYGKGACGNRAHCPFLHPGCTMPIQVSVKSSL